MLAAEYEIKAQLVKCLVDMTRFIQSYVTVYVQGGNFWISILSIEINFPVRS